MAVCCEDACAAFAVAAAARGPCRQNCEIVVVDTVVKIGCLEVATKTV